MVPSALDDLTRAYHRTWWALMLNGLLALTVGIFVFARPFESVAAFALVIALWALFAGFVDMVRAFELRRVVEHWWVFLLAGLIGVGFGVLALVDYPILSLTFAVVFVSWWLLLIGVVEIYAAYRSRRRGLHWVWDAAFGLAAIAAGVFALIAPKVTLATIMGLIAGFGAVGGTALIVGAFGLRSTMKAVTLGRQPA